MSHDGTSAQRADPHVRGFDHAVIATGHLDAAAREYEALGFTLTPEAHHPWGTANRLVQFADGNFIELLAIDRPEAIDGAIPTGPGRHFSFGGHTRRFLEHRTGMCMLALQGKDCDSDLAHWRAAGLDTWEPFHFERLATLPDGQQVKVAFSLAFATTPLLPDLAFFTCRNHFPEHFWKPRYQQHANGAGGIVEIEMSAPDPAALSPFFTGLTGTATERDSDSLLVRVGTQRIRVLATDEADRRFGRQHDATPAFRALRVRTDPASALRGTASTIGGVVIEWT